MPVTDRGARPLRTDLRASRELWVNLTLRDLRGKYKRTVLGQAWSLINPIAAMLVYTLVFGFLLRVQPEPGDPSGLNFFALWLLCGLLPWLFFANVLNAGMGSLLENANLIKKVYFPRGVLVGSAVASLMVTWAIEMVVLVIAVMIFGANPLPFLPLVVVAMLVLAVFALGLALLLSVANAYFRDTQYLMGIVLQVWFYLTPILFPLSYVQEQVDRVEVEQGRSIPLDKLFELNPMERFVEIFRNLLYDNRLPDAWDCLYATGSAVVALVVGVAVFRRFESRLAEEL